MEKKDKDYYMNLFQMIDKEEDREIYLRDAVRFLRVMQKDMTSNLKVIAILDSYDTGDQADVVIKYKQFKELMEELEESGWKKVEEKPKLKELDIKAIFDMVDVNRSGSICRKEAKVASKLLQKRAGIENVATWVKETDADGDGKITFKEFKSSIMNIRRRSSLRRGSNNDERRESIRRGSNNDERRDSLRRGSKAGERRESNRSDASDDSEFFKVANIGNNVRRQSLKRESLRKGSQGDVAGIIKNLEADFSNIEMLAEYAQCDQVNQVTINTD